MKFEKYVDNLEKNGKFILPIIGIIVIISLIGIFNLKINTDFSLFGSKDSSYNEASEKMEKAFGNKSQIIIMVPSDKKPENIRNILKFSKKCDELKGVDSSLTILSSEYINKSDDEILKQLEIIESISMGPLKPVIENKDGNWFTIQILLKSSADIYKTIDDISKIADKMIPGYIISGEPYLENAIFSYILKLLITLPPLAIILMIIVFRFRIGSFKATAMSMLPAVLSAIISLGVLSWTVHSVSIMSVLIPVFIIVLGSADGLHVTSHIIDLLSKGEKPKAAIAKTLDAVGKPIILTTLTTMAGFLSLTTVKSNAIVEMAITAAGGILLAGLVTWIILPVVLLHQKPLPVVKERKSSLVDTLTKIPSKWVIIICSCLILISIPGIFKIKTDFSMMDFYKNRTEVKKSIEEVEKITGSVLPLMIFIETEDYLNNGLAEKILSFQSDLEENGTINGSLSIYSMIEKFSEKLSGKKGYPKNDLFAKRIVKQVKSINSEMFNSVVAENGSIRIILFCKDLKTKTLETIVNKSKQLNKDAGVEVLPVGAIFEMMDMNKQIIPQQLLSIFIALIAVIILTSLFLKNIKSGIITAIPIIITLLGVFAVMGYFKIDISIITSIMSGMTIGVGIDYAIHYISLFTFYKKKGVSNPASMAVKFVATPVLANALGLSIGFSVMSLSPLQIHTTLSVLMWVTMSFSAFLSLSLLPILSGKGRVK